MPRSLRTGSFRTVTCSTKKNAEMIPSAIATSLTVSSSVTQTFLPRCDAIE